MAGVDSPDSRRAEATGGLPRWRVWVTEDESRFLPFQRYTVHAIVDGQEQTMRFYSKTAADRVAVQAGHTPNYPKFDLRSVYSSICHG